MIFYFTGTGNSKWVAGTAAEAFSEKAIAVSDYLKGDTFDIPEFTLTSGERIGFVFPVHSWGIPPVVRKFIKQLCFNGYAGQTIFGIFTCGDECGYTKEMFLKLIHSKGWECRHVCSVQMPNNYMLLPGFDVDSKELEHQKTENAKSLLPKIIQAIRDDTPINEYSKGSMSFLKSRVIYPLFCKYALNSRPFHTTAACTSCGICVKKCPTKNISITDRPVWGNHCTQCLSCINRCPARAVEYGNSSQKKGRYYFKK
jgi:ferredoxin